MNILLADNKFKFCYDAFGNLISEFNDTNINYLYNKYGFDPNTITDYSVFKEKRMIYCGTQKYNAQITTNTEMIYLITLNKEDYSSIYFIENCNVLVSNDRITWHNYLDETKYIEYVFDMQRNEHSDLEDTLKYYCKPINFIARSYNYILVLTSSQNIIKVYEKIKISNQTRLNNNAFNISIYKDKIKIKNTSSIDLNNIKVFVLSLTTKTKDSLEEF